jgi:16S rRNA processing protein RimM
MTVTPPVGLFEELPDDDQPGAEKLVEVVELREESDDDETDDEPAT